MRMIDIRKTIDTLSWEFLLNNLKSLGFPDITITWLKDCITTTSFHISLNGKLHGFFKSKRGWRQGDPLYPYLFFLALDYLSRLIKANTTNPNFNFHPKCERIGLTHPAFADDIILFSRGDVESVSILTSTLMQFKQCSELELNLNKSKLFTARVKEVDFQTMLNITGFFLGNFQ